MVEFRNSLHLPYLDDVLTFREPIQRDLSVFPFDFHFLYSNPVKSNFFAHTMLRHLVESI